MADFPWPPVMLSLKVTATASVFLLVLGVALGWLLARKRFPGRALLETVLHLPLVLPPTVVGYYLLLALGRDGLAGWTDIRLLFTWQAATLASVVVGMPLITQAARSAIASVDPALENAARTLGASEFAVFTRITLPLAHRGIVAGWLLATTRALGEFGATLMIAGNIPGRTQTAPLAIYDAVQAGHQQRATQLVVALTLLALFSLLAARWLERRA